MKDLSEKMVVWYTPENYDASKTLSQHAFMPKQCGKWYEDKYEGNISLCRKIGIANENEKYIKIDEIDSENFNEIKACKRCTNIAKKINYEQ